MWSIDYKKILWLNDHIMMCLKCQKEIKRRAFYGLHPSCFVDGFDLKEEQKFSHWDPKKSYSSIINSSQDTHYQGRYLKYSARMGPIKYILKLQEKDYEDLPAMEYLCNQIASLLKIKVPEYYLIKISESDLGIKDKAFSNTNVNSILLQTGQKLKDRAFYKTNMNPLEGDSESRMAFVTKNFLQAQIETLHHIYKYLPKGKKHYNCERIIKVIQEQTGKLKDTERFVEITLFDSFIGNEDRHGRNLGIIDTGKSKTLAPMYDNPSYLGLVSETLLGASFNISGCIQTLASRKPKMRDYIQEFERLNLKKACMKFIKKTERNLSKILETVRFAWISDNRKKAFSRFLEQQVKEMGKV